MLAQEFRDRTVKRRPWAPIRIKMSDGTEIEVRHPEFLKVELGSFLVFEPTDEDRVFAGHTFYNLDHVISINAVKEEVERN